MEKMIGILLLGFFLALLLFLLIFFMGNGALNRYFESSMYRRNVSKETIAMFQEYVSSGFRHGAYPGVGKRKPYWVFYDFKKAHAALR